MKRPGGFDGAIEPGEPSAPEERQAYDAAVERSERPERDASGVMRLIRRRFSRSTPSDMDGTAADGADSDEFDDVSAPFTNRQGPEARASEGSHTDSVPTEALDEIDRFRDEDTEDTREISRTSAIVPVSRRVLGALPVLRRRQEEDPVRTAERDLKRAERARRKQQRQERRRFSVQARRRRRNGIIAAGAVGALVLFVLAGVVTPLMAVRDIQVAGASLVDADNVEAALEKFEGVPLALVDDAEVHRALEPFPLIQRYAIERVPPHSLIVRIEERVPVIALEQDGEFALHDPAGVLLAVSGERPEGVPQGKGTLADVSSPAYVGAGTVLRDMPAKLRKRVVEVSATSPQDLTLTLDDGVRVLWGDAEQTNRKAVVLTAMVDALKDRTVEVIDVSSTEAPVFR